MVLCHVLQWDALHPIQQLSEYLCIALFSPPSVSCLLLKEEFLARFIQTRTRAPQQKKKKSAKSNLFAIIDTTAPSFTLQNKPNALDDKLCFI